MLVIRRRPGEMVMIGEDIEVEILDSSPSQVKLGIRAPKSVIVLRKEIYVTRGQNLASVRLPSPEQMKRLAESLKNPQAPPISPL